MSDLESIPAFCEHCGGLMVWVESLYLVHASTGSPSCEKMSEGFWKIAGPMEGFIQSEKPEVNHG